MSGLLYAPDFIFDGSHRISSASCTVPISEIRSIGVAGFLVAAISVLLTNTLVPAALALLGPRINAGRMPFTPKLDGQRAARTGNRWRKWGKV